MQKNPKNSTKIHKDGAKNKINYYENPSKNNYRKKKKKFEPKH